MKVVFLVDYGESGRKILLLLTTDGRDFAWKGLLL